MEFMNQFEEYRALLVNTAAQKLSPKLSSRISPEDAVQQALLNACKRETFFKNRPDVPTLRKLQIILEQTICSLERHHLQSCKRDVYKEVTVESESTASTPQLNWSMFADSAAGPLTQAMRQDRLQLIQRTILNMQKKDRCILELRLLQGLSNENCAAALGITTKNASIRFARAIQRLQADLSQFTQIS